MDALTFVPASCIVDGVRQLTVLAPPTLAGILPTWAVLAGNLPAWAVLALVGTSLLIAFTQTVVTQVIRLRASTNTKAALRLRELELHARSGRRRAK